ncbi:MAG TPA: hypothetical protein ACFCUY_15490 [Xenococcaceae cyanobacterium]
MNSQSQSWRCVLDPSLALSYYGSLIVENLSGKAELWIARELWNIIRNTDFYLHRPELIIFEHQSSQKTFLNERNTLEEIFWSLKEWNRVRQSSDIARLGLFWLGDSLQESLLPSHSSTETFWHWETLAHSLDNYIIKPEYKENVLTSAFRDTVALAVSLGSASILTYQLSSSDQDAIPDIGLTLENWGIPCRRLQAQEPMVVVEREYLRQLMVNAGLAKLLWAEVKLAILHLVIPTPYIATTLAQKSLVTQYTDTSNYQEKIQVEDYFWKKARAFWYAL